MAGKDVWEMKNEITSKTLEQAIQEITGHINDSTEEILHTVNNEGEVTVSLGFKIVRIQLIERC